MERGSGFFFFFFFWRGGGGEGELFFPPVFFVSPSPSGPLTTNNCTVTCQTHATR